MNRKELALIPPDKKIHRFAAILEILNQTDIVQNTLISNWGDLNDDSKSVYLSLVNRYNDVIPVGDYGGLYEGLSYLYSSYLSLPKKFLLGAQLSMRPRAGEHSSKINSTKAILFTYHGPFDNYFVNLADEVRRDWSKKKINKKYLLRPDENIVKVMKFVLDGKPFAASNSELAVSKAILDESCVMEVLADNKQFKEHEVDRTTGILRTLKEYHNDKPITTTDHRQAWSIMCKGYMENKSVVLLHPTCVTKSFPRFFELVN